MGRRSGKKRYKKKTYTFISDFMNHRISVAENNEPIELDRDVENVNDSGDNSSDESDSK